MFEKRNYPVAEMEELLNTSGKQNIDRKLRRYGVGFSSDGRGRRLVYTIESLPDPFKVYAIVKLGIPAQANFMKIRNLYYFLFCAEGFSDNPLIEMERIMDAEGIPMARQTITKWLNYLQHLDYITLSADNIKYYVIRKTSIGREYNEVDAETYKKGWAIYHHWKMIEGSANAYCRMYNTIGGHPYKKPIYRQNALKYEEIEYLIDLIIDTLPEPD